MKKIFSLLIACFCQVAYAYNPCCMPQQCCYSPCNDCCDCNVCCGCRPGFYVGAQVGYAWLCTPDHGRLDFGDYAVDSCCDGGCCYDNSHHCRGDRGSFAWGVFAGYNMRVCWDNLYVGIEGGYHGNGCGRLHFRRNGYDGDCGSRHRCELQSHDWNISGTVDYIVCDCFDIFLKVGGARVCERLKGHCHRDYTSEYSNIYFRNNCHHKWAPVVDVGGGYCIWNCLKLTLSYRGVFCDRHNVRDGFHITQDCNGDYHLRLRNCATIHALYGGAVFTF